MSNIREAWKKPIERLEQARGNERVQTKSVDFLVAQRAHFGQERSVDPDLAHVVEQCRITEIQQGLVVQAKPLAYRDRIDRDTLCVAPLARRMSIEPCQKRPKNRVPLLPLLVV